MGKRRSRIELERDAWARYERAADVVAKRSPHRRSKATKGTKAATGKRRTTRYSLALAARDKLT